MSDRDEVASLLADVSAHLEWLRASGTKDVPLPVAPAAAPDARAAAAPVASADAPVRGGSLRDAVRGAVGQRPVARPTSVPEAPPANVTSIARPVAPVPSAPAIASARTLDEIRTELGVCTRCRLCEKRKNIVFGVGNPKAQLVFVGEGPGEEEDNQGIPFVGAAGQLLTKMIEAMGISRDDVYICNVVKCRPPGNRNPEPDEIAACEPFLKAQLASIQPKVIVALGNFAAKTLLREETGITRLRGNWRSYEGIKLMPTFHPAYLLRSPDEKKKAWADLKLVMAELGLSGK